MNTRQRGDAAEAAVLSALTAAGLAVWLPWSQFGACDLMVETPGGQLVRVQVKCGRLRGRCVLANCRSTDHGAGRQSYVGLVDVLAIHVPELRAQFVVPVDEAQGFEVRLRLEATRNGQARRVRYAQDYSLEAWAAALVGPSVSPTASDDVSLPRAHVAHQAPR